MMVLPIFSICRRYDEMSERVNEIPDDTEGLVQLQDYLDEVITVFLFIRFLLLFLYVLFSYRHMSSSHKWPNINKTLCALKTVF